MAQRRAPNVIFIMADDMGYGDFGVFNNGLTRTPAIDMLVDGGLCLTQHYSASPVCAPARAGLLTGRYPHRTGVIDTYESLGLDRLSTDEITVADAFKAAGYATGLVGKWHCGANDPRYHPNRRGFGEFSGFLGGWSDYYDWYMERNGTSYKGDGSYITDTITDEAIEFIRRRQGEPFFLHLAYNAPHFPIQAPAEDVKYYRDRGSHTTAVSTLYGMIERMDQGIGRIVETLRRNDLEQNTILIFTSDNGPDFGGEGDDSLVRYNCNYRGSKTLVYEGGIRVPCTVRWPEQLEAGSRCDEVVHLTDWYPTLLDACGVPCPNAGDIDGSSVLPLLTGNRQGEVGRKLYWQWNRFTPFVESNAAVRDGNWKLVQPEVPAVMPPNDPREIVELDVESRYTHPGNRPFIPERIPRRERPEPLKPLLFNIADDPMEQIDLAETYPQKRDTLRDDLLDWFARVEADRRRPEPGNSPYSTHTDRAD